MSNVSREEKEEEQWDNPPGNAPIWQTNRRHSVLQPNSTNRQGEKYADLL